MGYKRHIGTNICIDLNRFISVNTEFFFFYLLGEKTVRYFIPRI